MPDFLLEIGTEEIPARMIDAAQAELARRVSDLITRERLAAQPEVTPFSTPRRKQREAEAPGWVERVTGASSPRSGRHGI